MKDNNIFRKVSADHPLYKSGFFVSTHVGSPSTNKTVDGHVEGNDDPPQGAPTQTDVVESEPEP